MCLKMSSTKSNVRLTTVYECRREKEKLRMLEERGVVIPHERSRTQRGKDTMAIVIRVLYEGQQQLKRKRL